MRKLLMSAAMAAASVVGAADARAGEVAVEVKTSGRPDHTRRRQQEAVRYSAYPPIRMNRSRRWREDPYPINEMPVQQRYEWARQDAVITGVEVQHASVR